MTKRELVLLLDRVTDDATVMIGTEEHLVRPLDVEVLKCQQNNLVFGVILAHLDD